MRRVIVLLIALLAGSGAALMSTGAFAHQSGCHTQHTCPSDHHTYVWYDGSGQGWDCASPTASEYAPSVDTTAITYQGITWYCHAAGSAPPTTTTTVTTAPTVTTTTTTTQTAPTTTTTTQTSSTTTTMESGSAPECLYRHDQELPDRLCTPGAIFSRATARQICRPGYSRRVRHISAATKRKVYAIYGITTHVAGEYEIDHLVPLELGGSNSIKNLWPEPAVTTNDDGFHDKDRLENLLHDRVCDGDMTLRAAQRAIRTNWIAAAHRYGV